MWQHVLMAYANGERHPGYKGERHTHMQRIPAPLYRRAKEACHKAGYANMTDYLNAVLAQALEMPDYEPDPVRKRRKRKPRVEAGVVEVTLESSVDEPLPEGGFSIAA